MASRQHQALTTTFAQLSDTLQIVKT